jgi:hypothetical protein
LNLRSQQYKVRTPGNAGSEIRIRKSNLHNISYRNFCGISSYALVPETIEEMNDLKNTNLIETN